MTFMQLVFRNVTRNRRAFLSYYFSSVFSVGIFFIFSLLYFHPQLTNQLNASSQSIAILAKMGMLIGQIIIVFLSFIFLWFSFSVFLHGRKRDFAIYLMTGASEKEIRKMLMLENMFVGGCAIFSGLFVGLVFSKFILLLSQKVLSLEEGLSFYIPWESIFLTFIAFTLVFVCISIFSTFKLYHENLAELSKTGERPRPEPQPTLFLSLLCPVLLLIGYMLVFYFAYTRTNFWFLASGVFFTVGGIYLLFHQMGIRIIQWLKKLPFYFRGDRLLSISELVFRIKDNATMFFLISVVATSAFVGIGTTMVLGSTMFATTQQQNVSFVYIPFYYNRGKSFHDETIKEVQHLLKETGEEAPLIEVHPLGKIFETSGDIAGHGSIYREMISETDYNKVAKVAGFPAIKLANDKDVVGFPSTMEEMQKIKKLGVNAPTEILTSEVAGKTITITPRIVDYQFNIGDGPGTLVVTDNFYHEIYLNAKQMEIELIAEQKEGKFDEDIPDYAYSQPGDFEHPYFIIHIKDWQKYGKQFNKVSRYLDDTQVDRDVEDIYSDSGKFYYSSLYQTWIYTRQSNGIILMTSFLLGAVFFTFAACILYFRLFGDLDREVQRHATLIALGVSEKKRHKIVRRELAYMFFLPAVVAAFNFAVAFEALVVLTGLKIWPVYFKILACYFIFQGLFYIVCRFRYIKNLDRQVEKTSIQ